MNLIKMTVLSIKLNNDNDYLYFHLDTNIALIYFSCHL